MAGLVVSPTQRKLLTVEEWAHRPDADRYELIDGVLRARMVNQNQHEFAVGRLAYVVNSHLISHGNPGSVFGSNTKYQVRPRRGIMPDLSVVLEPNLSRLDPEAAYNTVGPDLAVEVLSPDQGEDYQQERLDDYWRLGTAEVWFVNPREETVTGYSRGEQQFERLLVARGDEEFASQLLPGLRFSVGSLWMRRRAS